MLGGGTRLGVGPRWVVLGGGPRWVVRRVWVPSNRSMGEERLREDEASVSAPCEERPRWSPQAERR